MSFPFDEGAPDNFFWPDHAAKNVPGQMPPSHLRALRREKPPAIPLVN
jgi:hypothetical protein